MFPPTLTFAPGSPTAVRWAGQEPLHPLPPIPSCASAPGPRGLGSAGRACHTAAPGGSAASPGSGPKSASAPSPELLGGAGARRREEGRRVMSSVWSTGERGLRRARRGSVGRCASAGLPGGERDAESPCLFSAELCEGHGPTAPQAAICPLSRCPVMAVPVSHPSPADFQLPAGIPHPPSFQPVMGWDPLAVLVQDPGMCVCDMAAHRRPSQPGRVVGGRASRSPGQPGPPAFLPSIMSRHRQRLEPLHAAPLPRLPTTSHQAGFQFTFLE